MPLFKLPDPGEGLVEAEIVTWKVKPGDQVKVNDIVVEVETAKSLVELPIPWAGTVTELLAAEGDTVEVGTPIIDVDTGDAAEAAGDVDTSEVTGEERPDDLVPEPSPEQTSPVGTGGGGADDGGTGKGGAGAPKREAVLVGYGAVEGATTRRARKGKGSTVAGRQAPEQAPARPRGLAKPPVRRYAKDKGVDLAEVTPTREDGVITRADIDAFLAGGGAPGAGGAGAAGTAGAAAGAGAGASAAGGAQDTGAPGAQTGGGERAAYVPPVFDRSGERETRTPVKGVRKMTAQAMTGSAFTAPHVTEFITVDVTATMELIDRLKEDREFRDVRVNPMLMVAKAVVMAVRRNPGMVAVWDEDAQEIVQKNYVNLGIAAATPRGLVVPNVKDADLMDLRQLAQALTNLVETARAGRTQPAEMSGGSITITNVGVFGVDSGTPIINPGESAIVAMGAINRRPWVVTGPDGSEQIVPRWVTELAVSFDHRLIDGALGSRFLADLAALLEDPARALVWG